MHINRLSLKDFRNYEQLLLEPDPGLNILYGKNAQGKTNIAEAVYYLSTGKSFRTSRDTQMIRFNCQYAYINAAFKTNAGNNTEEAVIKRDGTKSFKINALPVKKLGNLFGHFSCIAFTPEDIKAVKETPSLRRRLMDVEISKIKPAYLFELKAYYKTLAEKNTLLRSPLNEDTRRLISVYNEQLAKNTKTIIGLRTAFIKELQPEFEAVYRFISGKEKQARMIYKPCVQTADIVQGFLEKAESMLPREAEYHQSFFGPHKEDMMFYIDDEEVKSFSSQGQQRTVMLSYKLAVLSMVKKRTGESPVLILDDVFSELDFERQKNLSEFLSESQVLITTAVPINVKTAHRAFIVENGIIKPMKTAK